LDRAAGQSRFLCPLREPEDIIPHLGEGIRHWREGRSAQELVYSWLQAEGFPPAVWNVLKQCPEYQSAQLLEGIFELETTLSGEGKGSQSDLLCRLKLSSGQAVVAVEGKTDEEFGPNVSEWLGHSHSENKKKRLSGICAALGLGHGEVQELRYQFLHRAAAALIEARRLGWAHAFMLVHSFSPDGQPDRQRFREFQDFAAKLGSPVTAKSGIKAAFERRREPAAWLGSGFNSSNRAGGKIRRFHSRLGSIAAA